VKRFSRFVGGAAAALLAGSALAVATPDSAVAAGETVSAQHSRTTITYGGTFRVTGSVKEADGSAANTGRIVLARKQYGARRFSTVRRDTDAGSFSFRVRPYKFTQYRLTYIDSTGTVTWRSVVVDVKVRRRATRPDLVDGTRRMRGTVAPAYRGKRVTLQVKSCRGCAWRYFDTVRTNRRQVWVRPGLPLKNRYYRAVVPKGNGWLGKKSNPLHVRVTYGRVVAR